MFGSTMYLPLMLPSNIFFAKLGNWVNPTIISSPATQTISTRLMMQEYYSHYLWLNSNLSLSAWNQICYRLVFSCPGAPEQTPPQPAPPPWVWRGPQWRPGPCQLPGHRLPPLPHTGPGAECWPAPLLHSCPHTHRRSPYQEAWLAPPSPAFRQWGFLLRQRRIVCFD